MVVHAEILGADPQKLVDGLFNQTKEFFYFLNQVFQRLEVAGRTADFPQLVAFASAVKSLCSDLEHTLELGLPGNSEVRELREKCEFLNLKLWSTSIDLVAAEGNYEEQKAMCKRVTRKYNKLLKQSQAEQATSQDLLKKLETLKKQRLAETQAATAKAKEESSGCMQASSSVRQPVEDNSASVKPVDKTSEVYHFRAAAESETIPTLKPALKTEFKDRRDTTREENIRHRYGGRSRRDESRGRSQSVRRDRSISLTVVTQKPDPTEQFLMISDLRHNYPVVYITNYNTDFRDAIKSISKCTVIGVDAEYKRVGRGYVPTYLQIAENNKAYVFNLQLLAEWRDSRKALKELWDLLTSKQTKVGQSLAQDLTSLTTFLGQRLPNRPDPVVCGCWSLEEQLFTAHSTRRLSLSHLSFRHFGKHMRKKQRETMMGHKKTIENELQMEYAALDALAPLELYKRYHQADWVKANHVNLEDLDPSELKMIKKPVVLLIDWHLWEKASKWRLNQSVFQIVELPCFTVKHLPKLLENTVQKRQQVCLIVTADLGVIQSLVLKKHRLMSYTSFEGFMDNLSSIEKSVILHRKTLNTQQQTHVPRNPQTQRPQIHRNLHKTRGRDERNNKHDDSCEEEEVTDSDDSDDEEGSEESVTHSSEESRQDTDDLERIVYERFYNGEDDRYDALWQHSNDLTLVSHIKSFYSNIRQMIRTQITTKPSDTHTQETNLTLMYL